jgi:hypothetical protein
MVAIDPSDAAIKLINKKHAATPRTAVFYAVANGKYLDEDWRMSITEMRSKARRLALEHGLDLLIVDYLQLLPKWQRLLWEHFNPDSEKPSRENTQGEPGCGDSRRQGFWIFDRRRISCQEGAGFSPCSNVELAIPVTSARSLISKA